MTALSGGQAARVGLAALMLSRFDIALLDEPTNDLDPRRTRPAGGFPSAICVVGWCSSATTGSFLGP